MNPQFDRSLTQPIYVTKHALTAGILKFAKGQFSSTDDGSRTYFSSYQGGYSVFVGPCEWTTDLHVAQARVADQTARKVKSLKAQVAKLESYVAPLKEVASLPEHE